MLSIHGAGRYVISNLTRVKRRLNQLLYTLFKFPILLLSTDMEISLTKIFFNGTRILTHLLYLRISCLLEEELDNVQGQSILKRSWLSSSMSWSPNIGNLFPFIVSLTWGLGYCHNKMITNLVMVGYYSLLVTS